MSLFLRKLALLLGCGLLAVQAGCGNSATPPIDRQENSEQKSQQTPSADSNGAEDSARQPTQTAEAGKGRRQNEIWTDSDGRQYIGQVPMDIYFDDPNAIALNATPVNGGEVTQVADNSTGAGMSSGPGPGVEVTPENNTQNTGSDTGTDTAAADGGWESMLSEKVLTDEITEVRNFLNGTVQSVGSYNSSLAMIEPKVASLAVLSNIARDHSAELTWKEDAPYIRDLAKQMIEEPLQRGKKDQARLQKLFENMQDTFNRSRPADLAEPADDGFPDVAAMSSVMKRIEDAKDRLLQEAGTESAFGSKKDLIQHEASILATFTHVIALEDYGYDDEEFQGYAKAVVDAARAIQTAADADDFATYELSLSKISTNCQACHSEFKN